MKLVVQGRLEIAPWGLSPPVLFIAGLDQPLIRWLQRRLWDVAPGRAVRLEVQLEGRGPWMVSGQWQAEWILHSVGLTELVVSEKLNVGDDDVAAYLRTGMLRICRVSARPIDSV